MAEVTTASGSESVIPLDAGWRVGPGAAYRVGSDEDEYGRPDTSCMWIW